MYKIAKYALTPDDIEELPFLKITTGKCSDDKKLLKDGQIIYHSRQKHNLIYQVDFNSVITLEGVVVPVKNIINVCINPVAEAFT